MNCWLSFNTRGFSLVSLTRVLWVTTNIYVPLLHPSGYLAILVVMVYRCHNWIEMLVASLFWKFAWHMLVPWELVITEDAFRPDQLRDSWVLHLKCMMTLVIESYLLLVVGWRLIMFCESPEQSWLTTQKIASCTFLSVGSSTILYCIFRHPYSSFSVFIFQFLIRASLPIFPFPLSDHLYPAILLFSASPHPL